jgi:MPBQ/MSBQ methyltransferase
MERSLSKNINAFYDGLADSKSDMLVHFDKIGFLNIGYWKGVEDSAEIAQINLIEQLVRFFSNKTGNVLDVACGKGASTKFLTKYFDPKGIVGINVAERQLELCKLIAPECDFRLMDATRLEFLDSSFDNILCIEAALHFSTRNRFLEEAYRVLKPSGRLAMLDFLCDYDQLNNKYAEMLPRENYLPDLEAYRGRLAKIGFKYVRLEDCTEFTIKAAADYVMRKVEREFGTRSDSEILQDLQCATMPAQFLFSGAMIYAIK